MEKKQRLFKIRTSDNTRAIKEDISRHVMFKTRKMTIPVRTIDGQMMTRIERQGRTTLCGNQNSEDEYTRQINGTMEYFIIKIQWTRAWLKRSKHISWWLKKRGTKILVQLVFWTNISHYNSDSTTNVRKSTGDATWKYRKMMIYVVLMK